MLNLKKYQYAAHKIIAGASLDVITLRRDFLRFAEALGAQGLRGFFYKKKGGVTTVNIPFSSAVFLYHST